MTFKGMNFSPQVMVKLTSRVHGGTLTDHFRVPLGLSFCLCYEYQFSFILK